MIVLLLNLLQPYQYSTGVSGLTLQLQSLALVQAFAAFQRQEPSFSIFLIKLLTKLGSGSTSNSSSTSLIPVICALRWCDSSFAKFPNILLCSWDNLSPSAPLRLGQLLPGGNCINPPASSTLLVHSYHIWATSDTLSERYNNRYFLTKVQFLIKRHFICPEYEPSCLAFLIQLLYDLQHRYF